MSNRSVLLRTLPRLGGLNLLRVFKHRLFIKCGLYRCYRPRQAIDFDTDFFSPKIASDRIDVTPRKAWRDSALYFGWFAADMDSTPDWFAHSLGEGRMDYIGKHWSAIPDAGLQVDDIKAIWEPSRFEWAISFAQQAMLGDSTALQRLNHWVGDWAGQNPAWRGPNWQCGQEASIRVMHLATTALILDQHDSATGSLKHFLRLHLQRISQTLGYALAQDNNHGTSEAAALFIGGSWLMAEGDPQAKKWMSKGRRLLEERARHLIFSDGGFGQYSLNYHRLMLETYSLAELWRRSQALPEFSQDLNQHLLAATNWLRSMVSDQSGTAPNIGANDGANLLPLTDADYSDFRPAVQLAMVLFGNRLAYSGEGPHTEQLSWLDLSVPAEVVAKPESQDHRASGFLVLQNDQALAVLRYPRFRFRPSQSDALHLDCSFRGENILRDAGSYSYSASQQWHHYFSGVSAHNTIQFDGRDQMPRLGRFLFGDWLKTDFREPLTEDNEGLRFAAGYTDYLGASHRRFLYFHQSGMRIEDHISGFQHNAVLRWRLQPLPDGQSWSLTDNRVSHGHISIAVSTDMDIDSIGIKEGWESRYYFKKTALPVLEVRVSSPGKIVSTISWQAGLPETMIESSNQP